MRRAALGLAIACALGVGACGGGGDGATCAGPGDAGDVGLTVTVRGETIGYGELVARMGRDCGEESVTIDGVQVSPTRVGDATFSVCLPDRHAVPATIDLATLANLYVGAELADGCRAARDTETPASGTLELPGFCAAGEPFGLAAVGRAAGLVQCGGDGGATTTEAPLSFAGVVVRVPGFVTP